MGKIRRSSLSLWGELNELQTPSSIFLLPEITVLKGRAQRVKVTEL